MTEKPTLAEATLKLEYYCSYQERCHQEVVDKLYQLGMKSDEIDAIVVHLLQHNFLNESVLPEVSPVANTASNLGVKSESLTNSNKDT